MLMMTGNVMERLAQFGFVSAEGTAWNDIEAWAERQWHPCCNPVATTMRINLVDAMITALLMCGVSLRDGVKLDT